MLVMPGNIGALQARARRDIRQRRLIRTVRRATYQHEATVAEDLLDYVPGTACLADGGYDADRILAAAIQRGLQPVIPPSEGRKRKRRYNKKLYRLRYRVEIFFHGLKRFRRIATRYDKTVGCYAAFLYIACALLWL